MFLKFCKRMMDINRKKFMFIVFFNYSFFFEVGGNKEFVFVGFLVIYFEMEIKIE